MREIVIIIGYPCTGKTYWAEEYVKKGYINLARSDRHSLIQFHAKMASQIDRYSDSSYVIHDSYCLSSERAPVISIAKKIGFSIKCVWIDASVEDSLFNSAWRILDEFKDSKATVTDLFGPNSSKEYPSRYNRSVVELLRHKKVFKQPYKGEGFDEIEKVPFVKRMMLNREYKNKAVIVNYDGTIRVKPEDNPYIKDPSEIVILPNRKEVLENYKKNGYRLLGVSNQRLVATGELITETCDLCFSETNRMLGVDIDYRYCPHPIFPVNCYCRKPLPGLGEFLDLMMHLWM